MLFKKMEGLDNPLFLCYNISMIYEIESFYFTLSFVVKDSTRRFKPEERARTCLKKPCVVALHIAKIKQLVRQLNKRRNTSEGIHLENHVVLPILSYIHKTKNTYYLESCLSYNYSHIIMIRDKKQQSVNYTMQSMYYSCGIHRFCIA